ncbi:protein of unknown function [Blastococcus saxobsidens DD2]|uniref:Uncharacterized protein n=1 Tax=Blastococcus saxobsidens (strain DD2) TaxID=1146883 RepID=H6RN78_BLASD|nr:protein of unknown function [Blastococcus saxobsidens DD2]
MILRRLLALTRAEYAGQKRFRALTATVTRGWLREYWVPKECLLQGPMPVTITGLGALVSRRGSTHHH